MGAKTARRRVGLFLLLHEEREHSSPGPKSLKIRVYDPIIIISIIEGFDVSPLADPQYAKQRWGKTPYPTARC